MELTPVRYLGEAPIGTKPVVLVVQTSHQLEELGQLASALVSVGVPAAVVIPEPPRKLLNPVRPGVRRHRQTVVEAAMAGRNVGELLVTADLLRSAGALVVMNDWGVPRNFVLEAQRHGVPTVAWVEGVQDFDDVDTGRVRWPYRTADLVFCLGRHDHDCLDGIERVLVGSERLRCLWESPPAPAAAGPHVAVNVNFSYGVQSRHRRKWVFGVLEAVSRAGAEPVLSRHPADRGLAGRSLVSHLPAQEVLACSSRLVSRFSTLVYEALLMGVDVVYHNPHGERVPTFKQSSGGFDVTTDVDGLAQVLDGPAASREDVRRSAQPFLRYHLELDAPVRPVDVALEHVRALRLDG